MHDFPHPHEHDEHEGEPSGLLDETDPAWRRERIELRSVGIDIGSSTSHLTFSRLVLRRMGAQLSSRFRVTERAVIHQSPILLTPYRDPATIDVGQLDEFICDAYRSAAVLPERIDTGAVIITGEAAKKENADAILSLFAPWAGRFVCAAAGPRLETIMAAHGSGAVEQSQHGRTLLNVDIGGGTTKLALCRDGAVADLAVINIGGRLVAHEGGRILRVEEPALRLGEAIGRELRLGGEIDEATMKALAAQMTDCLFELLESRPLSRLSRSLMHTPPLADRGTIDALTFSGGVSEYLYRRERREFGDVGGRLADAIRQRLREHPLGELLVEPLEGIRATVIGAAQYSVQVSGSTIYSSGSGVLPLRNLPVLPVLLPAPLSSGGVSEAVRRAIDQQDPELLDGPLALAIRWPFGPSYQELRALGEGLVSALGPRRAPTVIAFDSDIAKLVGHLLVEELGMASSLVAIDEIELADLDYIDVGAPLPVSGVIPVMIKSLVFRPSPDGGR